MVSIIVAAGEDGAIGRAGGLIWHLRGDLRRFKRLTMGHPVVMGRKTWESLPAGGLPGRRNIVVSRNPSYRAEGAEVCASLEEAIALCGAEDPFVIGGGEIYRLAFPLADRLYLTRVHDRCGDADARIPAVEESEWRETAREEGPEDCTPRFTHIDYSRR